jgi:hypothetical protein
LEETPIDSSFGVVENIDLDENENLVEVKRFGSDFF